MPTYTWGRSPGEGNGSPPQYSCLGDPTDRHARWVTGWGRKRVGHDLVTKPPLTLEPSQSSYLMPLSLLYPTVKRASLTLSQELRRQGTGSGARNTELVLWLSVPTHLALSLELFPRVSALSFPRQMLKGLVRPLWKPAFNHHLSGEGNGNPLQCSCLENPMDGGAWWATVYGVGKSRTQLSN